MKRWGSVMNGCDVWPQEFVNGVYSHAIAQQRWPELGLRDQAAVQLWERCQGFLPPVRPRAELLRVRRSAWFDERCLTQLQAYPCSRFISIGAGLSTRFHRLSQASDWPQFRWWELEGAEGARVKRHCFPVMDNYALIEVSEGQLAAELSALLAADPEPAVVLVEGPAAAMSEAQWQQLTVICEAAHCRVDLVFDCLPRMGRWRARCLSALMLAGLYSQVRFTCSIQLPTPGWQVIQQARLGSRLHSRLLGGWYGVHLRNTRS
ncbi:hypothetical protein [Gilvimarinus algae]|uniref:Uncharacterized protein n=1 Tax=Gilvimarinus algae TaxID=3058037 RepID=A0ABT8TDA8_9GAMM|nr:hypothetical protein [Gilvimarinus sp. SDUM040014]MDO3381921.1 hypothetical protein [Gilvimarinus sp. SDUM040014]